MNLNKRVFADRLKIPVETEQIVVLCPFHMDSGKSFSVNLDKGVFFCHGACDEPKGGGAVEFLIKWAKYVEKKPVTRDEARRMLRRTFTVPDARTLQREMLEDELRIFARRMLHTFANNLHEIDRTLGKITASCKGEPPESGHWKWDGLAALYSEQQWYEWAFDTCLASQRNLTVGLVDVYREAKARGLWNRFMSIVAAAEARKRAHSARIRNSRNPVHAPRQPVPSTTESESWQEPPSLQQSKRRQPVPPPRTPVQ